MTLRLTYKKATCRYCLTASDELFFSHPSSVAQYDNEETILEVDLSGPTISAFTHSGHLRYHEAEEGHSYHALSKLLIHTIFEHDKMFTDLCH